MGELIGGKHGGCGSEGSWTLGNELVNKHLLCVQHHAAHEHHSTTLPRAKNYTVTQYQNKTKVYTGYIILQKQWSHSVSPLSTTEAREYNPARRNVFMKVSHVRGVGDSVIHLTKTSYVMSTARLLCVFSSPLIIAPDLSFRRSAPKVLYAPPISSDRLV